MLPAWVKTLIFPWPLLIAFYGGILAALLACWLLGLLD